MRTNVIKNEIKKKLKKLEEKIKQEDLKYQTKKDTYDFSSMKQ